MVPVIAQSESINYSVRQLIQTLSNRLLAYRTSTVVSKRIIKIKVNVVNV